MIGTLMRRTVIAFYDAANERDFAWRDLICKRRLYAEGGSASAPYEFIPLVLKMLLRCRGKGAFEKIVLGNIPFSEQLPAVSYWIIADKDETSLPSENGRLKIYDAPVNVLTNDPPLIFRSYAEQLYGVKPEAAEKYVFR
ncbi:MAG: linear amide C-N hydrolase [Oscillospiraceae bacterium]